VTAESQHPISLGPQPLGHRWCYHAFRDQQPAGKEVSVPPAAEGRDQIWCPFLSRRLRINICQIEITESNVNADHMNEVTREVLTEISAPARRSQVPG
jgi:hypothetical protein